MNKTFLLAFRGTPFEVGQKLYRNDPEQVALVQEPYKGKGAVLAGVVVAVGGQKGSFVAVTVGPAEE